MENKPVKLGWCIKKRGMGHKLIGWLVGLYRRKDFYFLERMAWMKSCGLSMPRRWAVPIILGSQTFEIPCDSFSMDSSP